MFFQSALEAVKRRFGVYPRSAVTPLVAEAQAPSRLEVRVSNAQPQSDQDIRPIVDQLRRIDPLLDIKWNPEARLLVAGHYSETGKLTPPQYEGRWLVTRQIPRDDRRHYDGRDYLVIVEVTQPKIEGGVIYMERHGEYAPVGEWLIEYMRVADAANTRQFEKIRDRLWAQHGYLEEQEYSINEGEAREGLSRVLHKVNFAGGQGVYPGKGADFKDMEARSSSLITGPEQ